ncbi:hypothetical protein E2C01_041085 [Portunus trituberculatus]|uniref:Uncharacterized protein n=1 Tax=Portunus trituberculatus TaxID=210409 RepID=A0A5B7FQI2_PORTR|nr:hypothetical protein [Portunus trituberculatus]
MEGDQDKLAETEAPEDQTVLTQENWGEAERVPSRESGRAESEQQATRPRAGQASRGLLLYSPFRPLCTDWLVINQPLLVYPPARPCTSGAHFLSL